MKNPIPAPERTATAAELADERARLARARVTGAVRYATCSLCGALPYVPCQAGPPGDHLARWLAAYAARRITRGDLRAVIVRLVIITKWCVVTEQAPERAA